MSRRFLAPALFVLLLGCDSRPAAGVERGDCRPDQTCEAGLWCLSNLCVRPPPADCEAVATGLASFEVGNYAPPEDRAPIVARHRAACERAAITKEEGACLERAADRWSAERCAPRLFPDADTTDAATCLLVADRLQVLAAGLRARNPDDPQLAAYLRPMTAALAASCRDDRWPRDLARCALEPAQTDPALAACFQRGPRSLRERVEQQLQAVMRAQQQ